MVMVVMAEETLRGDLDVLSEDICHLAASWPTATTVCRGGGRGCCGGGGGGGGGGSSMNGSAYPVSHANATLLAGYGAAVSSSILPFTMSTLLFITFTLSLPL